MKAKLIYARVLVKSHIIYQKALKSSAYVLSDSNVKKWSVIIIRTRTSSNWVIPISSCMYASEANVGYFLRPPGPFPFSEKITRRLQYADLFFRLFAFAANTTNKNNLSVLGGIMKYYELIQYTSEWAHIELTHTFLSEKVVIIG